MSQLTHRFLNEYIPLRMKHILAECVDSGMVIYFGREETIAPLYDVLRSASGKRKIEVLYYHDGPCDAETDPQVTACVLRLRTGGPLVIVDPDLNEHDLLDISVDGGRYTGCFSLFQGLHFDGQLVCQATESSLDECVPKLVKEGLDQYFCTAPDHGEFWGYDIRRFGWLRAAQESAAFQEEFLRNARCFENRFELLNYALSKVVIQDGLYLEFGVFKGETIKYIASRVSQTVYGFDSFKGLPEHWDQLMPKGAFYTFGKEPDAVAEEVQFVKGWFSDTLPRFTEEHHAPCALVHVDCDLYSSTCDVLNGLADRIVPGTVLVFDEYFNFPGWRQHEYKAFAEFVETRALAFEYLGYVAPSCQVAVQMV